MAENGLTDVTLETLANGAAVELFARDWRELLENVQDPNTHAKAKRQIILTVTVEPHESRDNGQVTVQVKSKLAPHIGASSMIYMGERDGELVAVAHDVGQREIFADERDESVTSINRSANGDDR